VAQVKKRAGSELITEGHHYLHLLRAQLDAMIRDIACTVDGHPSYALEQGALRGEEALRLCDLVETSFSTLYRCDESEKAVTAKDQLAALILPLTDAIRRHCVQRV